MDRRAGRSGRRLKSGLCTLAAALLCGAAAAGPPAWRVTDAAGGELWLLGSVHYLRPEDYPLPPVVDELYARADALVMELDLDDLDPLATQAALIDAALLPPGTTLGERLGGTLYGQAAARARELGIELRLLERFEPWLVAVTLLERGLAEQGYAADGGVERYLLEQATRDGKEVLGLETIGQQVSIFDELSPAEQKALLEQTLAELDSASASIDELVAAWRDGRLEALADHLAAEFDAFPGLFDALVADRNRAWVASLERHLAEDEAHLVVVGALHLVGERNVPDLLRERGLTVQPVD